MAVYTKLTKEQISSHLLGYSLGELIDFKEIIEGIDNSNFIITTSGGKDSHGANKFILTIFESRIDKNELPFFINFKAHLAKNGVCCPFPISNNQGEVIVDLLDKKSSIVTFLSGATLKPDDDGYYGNITVRHCFEMGKTLAQLHLAADGFAMQRENELGINGWRSLFFKIEDHIEQYQKNLNDQILSAIDFLEKQWKFDLPSAATHLDLFPDNVFFDKDAKVSGVIDFYFAANDTLIYDFAVVVNAWCFDEKNNFSQEKFLELKNGYQKLRQFSAAELDFLKIALVGASMRFLLTRLNDKFFTPKDSLVKIKDPQEYLAKLQFFMKNL